MKSSGILLPISSLDNNYGIGTLGKCAYQFIDFLKKANQKYWQILPLGPTSYGDSPYQSFCVFAGNPYFIDYDLLREEGLLDKSDYGHLTTNISKIDYARLYETRFIILRKAFQSFNLNNPDFHHFLQDNHEWINNYSIFMTLKQIHHGASWSTWNEKYYFSFELLNQINDEYREEVDFWKFVQYEFMKQWKNLKSYANQQDIKIIGDAPIYVAYDSSDVWSNPQNFQLDEKLQPVNVAGCPPDAFSKTGQLWGNPLYDYEYMEETGYYWWIARMSKYKELYDVIRIDHFRGFEAYYSIPSTDKTAENGHWEKGPGMNLFNKVFDKLGKLAIIAEDLGFITKEVRELIKKTGFPGMKVLQFAFDDEGASDYLPHNYETTNCVVYTGTHDNMPTCGWLLTLPKKTKEYLKKYFDVPEKSVTCEMMVRLALASPADLAIIMLQDYLELGSLARINTPATSINNWTWRCERSQLTLKLARKIAEINKIYHRNSDNLIVDE